jgi:hypothetical protein
MLFLGMFDVIVLTPLNIGVIIIIWAIERIQILQKLRLEDEERRKKELQEKQRKERLEQELRKKREAGMLPFPSC